MRIYFSFILWLIHLSKSLKSYEVTSTLDSYNLSSEYSKEVPTTITTSTVMRNETPTEFLYIVIVVTNVNPADMVAYARKVCTGTMIRNDMVITLASCLLSHYNEYPDPERTMVFERFTSKGLKARKIYINPNYYLEKNYESKANDIGLVMVKTSKQTDYPQLPAQMYNFLDIKDTCIIGGYGNMDPNIILTSNFQFLYLNKTSVEIFTGCKNESLICLHFGNFMPCKEDQGSPIICNGVLYALYTPRFNSFSTKCIEVYITTFAPVYKVTNWVNQILIVSTSNLEWLNNPWIVFMICVALFILIGGIYYGLVEVLQRKLDPTTSTQTRRGTIRATEGSENSSLCGS